MTIKCFKLLCEKCGIVGTSQVWINHKTGEIQRGRVRHYTGLSENAKPQFDYHAQTKDYLVKNLKYEVLKAIGLTAIDSSDLEQKAQDQKLKELNKYLETDKLEGAGSLARLGHLLDVQKVAGSSPVRPTPI
jgi:hypothetical protein